MELRRLGNSGLKVSAIGLGGNTFGRTVDGDAAVGVIRRALDVGINFIDTADIYSFGRSEELVGQAIAGRRSEVILTTKCGMAMSDDPYHRGLSRRWIMSSIEASLRRLGTDYLDLYPIVQRIIREEGGGWMHDFTDAFDGDELLYIDGCHVNERGNEIMARRIDALLDERLDALEAARGSH